VIYSYKKSQQDALYLKFILVENSTCFGQIYRSSSSGWNFHPDLASRQST